MKQLFTINIVIFSLLLCNTLSAQWLTNTNGIYYNQSNKNIGIGYPPNTNYKLYVHNTSERYSMRISNTYNYTGTKYGIYITNTNGTGGGSMYGIRSYAYGTGTGRKYGIYSSAHGKGIKYGIYSYVSGDSTKFSGYFSGGDIELYRGNFVIGGPHKKFILHTQFWTNDADALVIAPKNNNSWDWDKSITYRDNGNLEVKKRIQIGTNSQTQIYASSNRILFRSNNTDNAAQIASYGLYLPQKGKTYNLYVAGNMKLGYLEDGRLDIRNTVRIKSNGKSYLNGGNIGIGTTSPNYKLEVRGYICNGGSDFVLGKYDGRNQGSKTANRALVHYDAGIGNDNLIINYNGDFEGGVHIMGPKTVIDNIIQTKEILVSELKAGEIKATDIQADDINLSIENVADYVFEDDYDLRNLNEVETFVKKNKHLPDVPAAKELESKGMNVSKMSNLLLQKIEELTLYVIDLKKENESLKKEINNIKSKL